MDEVPSWSTSLSSRQNPNSWAFLLFADNSHPGFSSWVTPFLWGKGFPSQAPTQCLHVNQIHFYLIWLNYCKPTCVLGLIVGNRQLFFMSSFSQPPLEVLYQHSALSFPMSETFFHIFYKNVSWCSGIGQFLILSSNTHIFSPRPICNLYQLGIFAMTIFFTYKISKWSSYVTICSDL